MDRMVLDLGIAREDESLYIRQWKYLYIGDVTGDVKFRFPGTGWVNPDEFDKLSDVSQYHYIYFTNTAQEDEELVIYFEEKKPWWKL